MNLRIQMYDIKKTINVPENHKEELNPTETLSRASLHERLIGWHLRQEIMWADMKH